MNASATTLDNFQRLMSSLKYRHGYDFIAYEQTGLKRRIAKRIARLQMADFAVYRDYLNRYPDEMRHLLEWVCINRTEFFRDPLEWDQLIADIIPGLLQNADQGCPLRVWSAGCSTGEEAYSLAIAIAEAQQLAGTAREIHIVATDLNSDSILYAENGRYAAKQLSTVKPKWRERYFIRNENMEQVHPDLRMSIIFQQHDLLRDPYFEELDLLVCRNTLLYLTLPAQNIVRNNLYRALKSSGCILFGSAEMPIHDDRFRPIHRSSRIYRKAMAVGQHERLRPERTELGHLPARAVPLISRSSRPTV